MGVEWTIRGAESEMVQSTPPLRDFLSALKGWVNSIPTMNLKSIGTMSIFSISP